MSWPQVNIALINKNMMEPYKPLWQRTDDDNGNEFTVSEEQLAKIGEKVDMENEKPYPTRRKGVDTNGNFMVEESPYNKVTNVNDNGNGNTPANAVGTTVDGVDGNIDWNNTEEVGETGVKPLDVKPITPAISGDPNETEEDKAARKQQRQLEHENEVRQQKINDYVNQNPYVLEGNIAGLYDKYKNNTPAEMLYNIAQYRQMAGLPPLTMEEKMLLLAGRDPNKSKKQETREKRRAKWADVLNELGNVMAHFYNFGRAKAGSPAATINHTPSNNAARLKAADMAMRQKGYNDYVNAVADAEKRRQNKEDALENQRIKRQQAIEDAKLETVLKKYKLENDPEAKLHYKILMNKYDISEVEKQIQKDKLEDERAYRMGISPKAIQEKRYNDARIAEIESRTNKNNRSGSGGSKGGRVDKYTYSYVINGTTYHETDEYRAYERAMAANHPNERIKKKGTLKREDLIHAGVSFPGDNK